MSAGFSRVSPNGYFNYQVVSGDNLWSIAQRFGTTMEEIIRISGLASNLIYPGQVLKIPGQAPQVLKTIVIDPGHGGHDYGAVFGARRESDDNLRLALAVQRLLQDQGLNVIMTRSSDTFISLSERSEISNRNKADLFVSIHRDASTNKAKNGAANYVSTTASSNTVQYAFDVLDEIVNAGVQSNRGVLREYFAASRNTIAPVMILEMGFITNVRDNELFDQNINAYTSAIARGIIKALNEERAPKSYFFHNVGIGDNLRLLAQRFNTTPDAIMQLNKLTTNSILVGQVLKIPSNRMIALTFDDGPVPDTERLLDILERYNTRATFFVVGSLVEQGRDTLIRAANMGNEIAGHSWSHPDLRRLSDQDIANQILSTSDIIESVIGYSPRIFRPPYGFLNDNVRRVSGELGYSIVTWTLDTLDWYYLDADIIYNTIMNNVRDGDNILLHDIHATTIDAMERVIPRLIDEGFQLVTVSELLAYKYGELEPGVVYGRSRLLI